MPKKPSVTEAQIDEICRLREEEPNLSWKRIAHQVGCTEEGARYWARERGAVGPRDVVRAPDNIQIAMRNGRPVRPFSSAERERLLQREPRESYYRLARELGRNKSSVRAFFVTEARRQAIIEGAAP